MIFPAEEELDAAPTVEFVNQSPIEIGGKMAVSLNDIKIKLHPFVPVKLPMPCRWWSSLLNWETEQAKDFQVYAAKWLTDLLHGHETEMPSPIRCW